MDEIKTGTTGDNTEKAVETIPHETAPAIGNTTIGSLLEIAIRQDLDIEKLERLIQLKNDEEARQCKKEFDFTLRQCRKILSRS